MELKTLIEELQAMLPHAGAHAPVSAGPLQILSAALGNGRVKLEVPEADIDDYPKFKEELNGAEITAQNEKEHRQRIEKAAREVIKLYRTSGVSYATESAINDLDSEI